MIEQRFFVKKYDWCVTVFYAVTGYEVRWILQELRRAGCPSGYIRATAENLRVGKINSGITYSNKRERRTVMVIGLCDSARQYANSIAHERAHLVTHIAGASEIEPEGEEICYLAGEIASKMFDVSHKFICADCLRRLKECYS